MNAHRHALVFAPRPPARRLRSLGTAGAHARAAVAAGGGLVPCAGLWIWWAAVEGGYPPSVWLVGAPAMAMIGLALAVLAPRPRLTGLQIAALGCLLAFAAWTWLSIAWADSPGAALIEAERRSLVCGAFALALLWPPSLGALRLAVWCLIVAAGVVAVAGLASALGGGALADGRLTEPTAYPNANAAMLAMGALAALVLAARPAAVAAERAIAWAACGSLAGVALLAQSRGSAIAVVVALGALFVLAPFRMRLVAPLGAAAAAVLAASGPLLAVRTAALAGDPQSQLESACWALALLAFALAAAGWLWGPVEARIRARWAGRRPDASQWVRMRRLPAVVLASAAAGAVALTTTGWVGDRYEDFTTADYERVARAETRFQGGLGSNRTDYWRVSLEELAKAPAFGAGAGGFRSAYLADRRTDRAPRYAHGVAFGVLGDLGVPGFLAMFGFVASVGVGLTWTVRRAPPQRQALLAAASIPLVYLGAHAAGDWVTAFPALTVPAFGLAGAALAWAPSRDSRVGVGSGAWVAATALAVFAVLSVPVLQAERLANRGASIALDRPSEGLAALRDAARLNPLAAEPPMWEGLACALLDRHSCARTAFAEAVRRDPAGWLSLLELGLLEQQRGNATEASRLLAQAAALNPRESLVRRVVRGDAFRGDASAVARQVLELPPLNPRTGLGGRTEHRSSGPGPARVRR